MSSNTPAEASPRPRNLAWSVVASLAQRIRCGDILPGHKLPSESALMQEFGVSRTVVREALSRLQAAGLAETHHGVGSYALQSPHGDFRIDPADIATVRDVMVLLELRIPVESEAAGLAALRRSVQQLQAMRRELDRFAVAIDEGGDTVTPDYQFHFLISQATGNRYFAELMAGLGAAIIPRTRISAQRIQPQASQPYLARLLVEHEMIYDAIERQDADGARAAMRSHLGNSTERLRRAQSL
ncbi:GntR family transcriptional regulator [Bordetella trematum]|uniref:FadR/GntR family transcriptional regulator n=1 Tax=Bordetella trematum TaxID=123899 RepID=UPI00046EE1F9|nr:FadR/GntR family transcriptional regulator [Bordetella trematum]AUL46079.1 GntR family transcriptional regulator [Bordetella trematum]QIM71446.1 FadR family transcriptional regulator [Bordetella trematum]SAI47276.1 GntR family transcriptional regulator [Bordetella trematum]